jgi:glycosyltransferase involved in cell wall biosynthesis
MSDGPLVSLILLVYNHERFVAEAIHGALSQTYSPLEIILSDDCSKDESFAIIERETANYRGKHAIRLNRNARNLGFARHLSWLNTIVRGNLVVVAAGDDVSNPNRVERLVEAWTAAGGGLACLCSSVIGIDESSRERGLERHPEALALNAPALIRGGASVPGCSQAWARDIFTLFGPMQAGSFQEDIAIPFRASLGGKILYVEEPLVRYRRHAGGMWSGIAHKRSTEEARQWFRRWARNLVFLNRGFRRDVATARGSGLLTSAEAASLSRSLAVRRAEVHTELLLLGKKPLPVKLIRLALSVYRGTTLRRASRWILMIFALPMYIHTLRRTR